MVVPSPLLGGTWNLVKASQLRSCALELGSMDTPGNRNHPGIITGEMLSLENVFLCGVYDRDRNREYRFDSSEH